MRTVLFFVCLVLLAPIGTLGAGDQPTGTNVLSTGAGALVIHPIEHATFAMEWNGTLIAVDPVGGDEAFGDRPKADLILVTHTHGDHFSLETIALAGDPTTPIIAPASVAEAMPKGERARVTVVANGESTTWRDVVVEAVPMYNLDPKKQKFHPKGLGNGYVLNIGGKRIYISGDTEDIPDMRALENIDAAFVCMNLPYTMDVASAADAVLAFQPNVVFPYHYRGKDGMSDLQEFTRLVSKNPAIEVRVLAWY